MAELTDERKYIDEWTRMMLVIWKEKIERLRIVHTGSLHQSFSDNITQTEVGTTISMKFARYGIYQALGVGRGYDLGNGGHLEILEPEYRHTHRLDKRRRVSSGGQSYMTSGKPRRKRDWINAKLYMSIMAMKEDLARITGEELARVFCDNLSDIRSTIR